MFKKGMLPKCLTYVYVCVCTYRQIDTERDIIWYVEDKKILKSANDFTGQFYVH